MTNYKNTINLPGSSIAMKANLPNNEPKRLEKWESLNINNDPTNNDNEPFIIIDGPPYANGKIHLGHALNKIIKDIYIRSNSLSGKKVELITGFDCHGLPIEAVIEKKRGRVSDKFTSSDYRKACSEYALTQVNGQIKDFKRLGILANWDNSYMTMDQKFQAQELRALASLYDKGHIVRGLRPVHWCINCGSGLSEAEVEHIDKISNAIYVRFQIDPVESAEVLGIKSLANISFLVWTTTPWSLPGNVAIAVNPNIDYIAISTKTTKGEILNLIIAEKLLEDVTTRTHHKFTITSRPFSGEMLKGFLVKHPYENRNVPVILADHVSDDAGSGIVHQAPSHGMDDFISCKKEEIDYPNPLLSNGVFDLSIPFVGGMPVKNSENFILDLLIKNNTLICHEDYLHSYPHCWRHKTPLYTRATTQWFISMDKSGLRKKALNAIKETKWSPEWGENRIKKMIERRPDWCISRQRTWGVPIAIFLHRETGEPHKDTSKILRQVADEVEKKGIDVWNNRKQHQWLKSDITDYEPCTDILDVWFDSGTVHWSGLTSTGRLDQEQRPPQADIYIEGSDQHRGWFQSSLLLSVALHDQAPYKHVLTHGFVVDKDGRKMSKSLGNIIVPSDIINKYGADILRLWVSSVDVSKDISVSDKSIETAVDAYRKIRNTARFLIANISDFDPIKDEIPTKDLIYLDAWMLDKTNKTQKTIIADYKDGNFHSVFQNILGFCTEASANYLDISKDRLYLTQKNSKARRSSQTTINHIVQALICWISPILCFTADEIAEKLSSKTDQAFDIYKETWHKIPETDHLGFDIINDLSKLKHILTQEMERLRSLKLAKSLIDTELTIFSDSIWMEKISSFNDQLHYFFMTSNVKIASISDAPKHVKTFTFNDNSTVKILLSITEEEKCERCWKHSPDVGFDLKHFTLCGSCVNVINGVNEERLLA